MCDAPRRFFYDSPLARPQQSYFAEMLSDTPMRMHDNFRSVPRGTTAAPASWSRKDGVGATMPPGNAQTHRRVSKLIPFGVGSLRRALDNYMGHYHEERNHLGKSNVLLFPQKVKPRADSSIECSERLGGLRLDILPSRNVQCMALESFADHSLQADSSFLNDLLVACRLRADERRRLCVRHHQR